MSTDRTPRRNTAAGASEEPQLEAVAAACARAGTEVPVDAAEFARRYYRNAAREDLAERSVENLACAALAHLKLAARRPPGRFMIRVYNPDPQRDGWQSPHTVVDVVNDDMPFLVDSSTMTINRLGYAVQITVHPLIALRRDGGGALQQLLEQRGRPGTVESFIHLEITREPEAQNLERIAEALAATLSDVRHVTSDWPAMLSKLRLAATELRASAPPLDAEEVEESCALLDFLADDHFTLLGYQEHRLYRRGSHYRLEPVAGTALGILRGGDEGPGASMILNERMREVADSPHPLIITKADVRATVHRPGYMDYLGVKVFDADGRAVRERRFLGLHTSSTYSRRAVDIPLLRRKVKQVVDAAGVSPRGHRGKALLHILDTYPRDELFQSSLADLERITTGILNLQDRQRVRLFVRRDDFLRFYSCLLYVPRERYNTAARERIEAILLEDFSGEEIDTRVHVDEAVLARLYVLVRTAAGAKALKSIREIEERIAAAVTTWQDRLRALLMQRCGEFEGNRLFRTFGDIFPAAYMEEVDPADACLDITRVQSLLAGDSVVEMHLYRPGEWDDARLRFKICRAGEPYPLSKLVPVLENMGLSVLRERPYLLHADGRQISIRDLDLLPVGETLLDPAQVQERFQHTFRSVLDGAIENDALNRLVVTAGLDTRRVALMRACTKYLVQTGLPFSQAYLQEVLLAHPGLVNAWLDLFAARFDPDTDEATRETANASAAALLDEELAAVASLDEDRILRAYVGLVQGALRTNYYRRDEAGEAPATISLKLDPRQVPELPAPRPRYEIFVYSPRVEGVHLRAGPVARGGLRWSDRREDFRTEVLGLMKAQQVKNTIIVPAGAKGGFVCKQLPAGSREEVHQEVRSCYRLFIGGLLDVTDNIVDGHVVPPPRVRRMDDDDPYLVVAADKGTATFSDLANEIAAEYDFWLGDAFASGGSNGYDHKRMGITARGAWEAVKRHFRELGVDVQGQEFTVAGIGDMSGDVFGNGMLQSRHIRLLAAFNHRHVFVDPDPDPERSYAERKRLFELPASSWEDYDREVLSEGGGIYSRQAKSIALSARAREVLGIKPRRVSPPQLVQAILRMPVDLLFNGGIGTYVKASQESHDAVGDRANDNVRVDGRELRCKVVGEGGNLGVTQLGRAEYAQQGGRINTDFVDNSGGVECSDREVNIKILLASAMRDGKLKPAPRNRLLARMRDEVAEMVLRTSYQQTQAIAIAAQHSQEYFSENARALRLLENAGYLDRKLEGLPSDEEIEERRTSGRGFTRPELAMLLSYARMALFDDLCDSDVPEDPYLSQELARYFPEPLREQYEEEMRGHRLNREIIALMISGSMINRMGPAFLLRIQEETGAEPATVARAYTAAREITGVRVLWEGVEALDNRLPAKLQYELLALAARHLRYLTHWFLRHHLNGLHIQPMVSLLAEGVTEVLGALPRFLPGGGRSLRREIERWEQRGVPEELATHAAALPFAISALDIVEVSQAVGHDLEESARTYFEIGRAVRLDWLRREIEKLAVQDRWHALGRGTLRGAAQDLQRRMLQLCLRNQPGEAPGNVSAWLEGRPVAAARARRIVDEMQSGQRMDYASASVALEEMRRLAGEI